MKLDDFAFRAYDFFTIVRNKHGWRKIAETGGVSLPLSFTFEPTMACNLACPFCYQRDYRKNVLKKMLATQLTTNEIKNIFTKLRPHMKSLGLVGGEIFVRKDMLELLRFFDSLDIPINIVTNGVLIDKAVAKKLKGIKNLEAICYSIHGLENTHDKSVGRKGAFNKAIDGIRNMVGGGGNVWISTNTVLNRNNLVELTKIIKFLKKIGVDSAGFQLELFSTEGEVKVSLRHLGMPSAELSLGCKQEDKYEFPFSEFWTRWQAAKKQARKLGFPINLTSNIFKHHAEVFFQGKIRQSGVKLGCFDLSNCRIDAWGNVVGCVALKKTFGNLKDKSFIQIINSREFREFRKKILQGNLLPACKRCCQATLI